MVAMTTTAMYGCVHSGQEPFSPGVSLFSDTQTIAEGQSIAGIENYGTSHNSISRVEAHRMVIAIDFDRA